MADDDKPEEPYIIKGRDALYSITRQDLIEEYKDAVNNYRQAKEKVMAIRFAVRGLSMLTGHPIPSNMDHGPILPEERMHREHGPVIHGPSITAQRRAKRFHRCPACNGSGRADDGNKACPDCKGAGRLDAGALSHNKSAMQQNNERKV